ncbi:MAG: aldehyde dehydrogenase family protein [Betaproteobacteria bacterium]|nr:aldehyde dehydrogenase family protein [Betaproteobacteria bacterium]
MGTSSNILSPYINGRFLQLNRPERIFHTQNPVNPGDVLAVTGWNKDLVGEIVEAAKRAQFQFAAQSLSSRMQFVNAVIANLRQSSEEMKSQMMLELGRSRWAVEREWELCEELFRHLPRYCSDELSPQKSELGWSWSFAPVGLILVSSNVALPVYTALYSVLTSIAVGNAVVFRPSAHCPLSASLIASCFHQASPVAGLLQVVYGDLEVYRRLVLSHQFDTIFYTGGEESLEQLRRDMSTDQNVRLVLCGGGKNAAIISADADMDSSVSHVLLGACLDAGQRLESTGLAFVDRRIADAFVERFVRAVKQMPIGVKNQLSDASQHVMGPLASQTSWDRFLRFQGIAARESRETLRWGKAIDNPGGGYFVSPGVHLIDCDKVKNSVYASNAFFAPDVAIVPVDSIDEAVSCINELASARSVSVFSQNEGTAMNVRRHCVAPLVLNAQPTTQLHPLMPTMGRGKAGNSCVMGLRFLKHTVYPQTLNMNPPPVTSPVPSSGSSAKRGVGVGKLVSVLFALLLPMLGLMSQQANAADYRKSVEGNEVVKGKFYPKSGRFQINAGGGGLINQSFINTFLVGGALTYHFQEWHAINFEVFAGISSDKADRTCIENFYLDEDYATASGSNIKPPCPLKEPVLKNAGAIPVGAGTPPDADKRGGKDDAYYGSRAPFAKNAAYMPIRELTFLGAANYQWTPVYGKSLFFLSQVLYLDFYLNAGLGLAMSNFFPLKDKVEDPDGNLKPMKEVGTIDDKKYGKEGRPAPQSQTSPMGTFAIGSRFYMARRYLLDVQLKNYSIIGENGQGGSDFTAPFALLGGIGILL